MTFFIRFENIFLINELVDDFKFIFVLRLLINLKPIETHPYSVIIYTIESIYYIRRMTR